VIALSRERKVAERHRRGLHDLAGDEDLVEGESPRQMDFDLLIATPDMDCPMGGQAVGCSRTRGALNAQSQRPAPSPRPGRRDPRFKAAELEFRADRTGIVHVRFGQGHRFTAEKRLLENTSRRCRKPSDRQRNPVAPRAAIGCSLNHHATMGPAIDG